jgi:two-component system, chemotaxis family, sensor kinase Cph1
MYHDSTAMIPKPFCLLRRCVLSLGVWLVVGLAASGAMSQEMIRQHQLLSAELQHHQSVMMLIDVESGQILDANDAAAAFYGYSIVDLRNMHIQQINVLPEDQIQAEMQRAHQEKRNQFIFPHRLANGDIRRVEVFASPVVSEAGQKMLLSVVHDISNLVLDNTTKNNLNNW